MNDVIFWTYFYKCPWRKDDKCTGSDGLECDINTCPIKFWADASRETT